MRTVLAMMVHGRPVPQGSMVSIPLGRMVGKRFVPVTDKTGRPIVNTVASNRERLDPWRDQITSAARELWGGRLPLTELDDFEMWCEFLFRRPLAHYGTGRNALTLNAKGLAEPKPRSTSYGDTDKLERAVLDALTAADVWVDDRLVTDLHGRKRWTKTRADHEGVKIWIQVPA